MIYKTSTCSKYRELWLPTLGIDIAFLITHSEIIVPQPYFKMSYYLIIYILYAILYTGLHCNTISDKVKVCPDVKMSILVILSIHVQIMPHPEKFNFLTF